MNLRPLGYEPSGTVQHSLVPCGFVQYRLAAGGTFTRAVSTHAKAVQLQQASLQLAGAPGQRGDQPCEPVGAADSGACSDNDGDTAAGLEGQGRGWARANADNRCASFPPDRRIELRRARSWLSPRVRFCRCECLCHKHSIPDPTVYSAPLLMQATACSRRGLRAFSVSSVSPTLALDRCRIRLWRPVLPGQVHRALLRNGTLGREVRSGVRQG